MVTFHIMVFVIDTTSCHLEDNFDCRNGVCVSRQARCDGQPDCQFSPTHSSSADEEDCGEDLSDKVTVFLGVQKL